MTRCVSAEIYDPSDHRWSPAGTLSAPRSGFAMIALPDGGALVVGGLRSPTEGAAGEASQPTNDGRAIRPRDPNMGFDRRLRRVGPTSCVGGAGRRTGARSRGGEHGHLRPCSPDLDRLRDRPLLITATMQRRCSSRTDPCWWRGAGRSGCRTRPAAQRPSRTRGASSLRPHRARSVAVSSEGSTRIRLRRVRGCLMRLRLRPRSRPILRAGGAGPVTDVGKPKHLRYLSVKPVGAWRNGRARALGVPGAYAV